MKLIIPDYRHNQDITNNIYLQQPFEIFLLDYITYITTSIKLKQYENRS